MSQARRGKIDWYALSIVGSLTLLALFLAFAWWMSPLGIGFAVSDPGEWAWLVYQVSYFGGIPMLLVGQVAGIVLACLGRGRAAIWVALSAIILFVGAVLLALGLLGLL